MGIEKISLNQSSSEVKTDELTVEQKFAKAMLILPDIRPFYSSFYRVIEKIKTDSIETMGVTVDKFYYNEKFCEKLSFGKFMFIILHEIAHIALMHPARLSSRDKDLWNIACDLYVNKLLADEFFTTSLKPLNGNIEFPLESLYFDKIDIERDAVDTIYDELKSQGDKNGYFDVTSDKKEFEFVITRCGEQYKININRQFSGDLIASGKSEMEDMADSRRVLTTAKVQAELGGGRAGSEAGYLERICAKLLESKLDWRKLIRKYLIAYQQGDLSYSKPDKRMYWQEAIYPGPVPSRAGKVKDVKICIDTSGSISDKDLQEFLGHIKKLVRQFKVEAELIYWDAEVESAGNLTSINDIKRVAIKGGGGTDPSCVFKYFDDKRARPILTVMLTDGYIMDSGLNEKGWPKKYKDTIWIISKDGSKNFKPPFGKVASIKDGLNN